MDEGGRPTVLDEGREAFSPATRLPPGDEAILIAIGGPR